MGPTHLLYMKIETDAKKYYWPKIRPIIKINNFLPNQADTHELVIFTKFHKDWVKIVDFFIKIYFWASKVT